MYGQGAQAPSIEICSMSIFSSYFFQKYFLRKNWRGGVESLLKNGTIDGYAY